MVAACHPRAVVSASISVSQLAPPVPHEFSGEELHPCGGFFHSPAGWSRPAQCSTSSWSARPITIICSVPCAVRLPSMTISLTAFACPRLSSRRHRSCAPFDRASQRLATSIGVASPTTGSYLGAGVGSTAATGLGGGGGVNPGGGVGFACWGAAAGGAASAAVCFTNPGGTPNSVSSASTLSPEFSRWVMWLTASE